jgi:hypothetical protein
MAKNEKRKKKDGSLELLFWPQFSIFSTPRVEACYGGTLI